MSTALYRAIYKLHQCICSLHRALNAWNLIVCFFVSIVHTTSCSPNPAVLASPITVLSIYTTQFLIALDFSSMHLKCRVRRRSINDLRNCPVSKCNLFLQNVLFLPKMFRRAQKNAFWTVFLAFFMSVALQGAAVWSMWTKWYLFHCDCISLSVYASVMQWTVEDSVYHTFQNWTRIQRMPDYSNWIWQWNPWILCDYFLQALGKFFLGLLGFECGMGNC